jgi:hypothetical protein
LRAAFLTTAHPSSARAHPWIDPEPAEEPLRDYYIAKGRPKHPLLLRLGLVRADEAVAGTRLES